VRTVWQPEQVKRLIDVDDPRAFLARALEERSKGGRKLGYAALARLSGFSSRNYPRDVLIGAKFLTSGSSEAIARGLKLNADLRAFFCRLVEKDNLRRAGKASTEVEKVARKINVLRSHIQRKITALPLNGNVVYSVANASIVFAAAGTPQTGADLKSICSRTNLPQAKVQEALAALKSFELVKEESGRYYPVVNHVAFENLEKQGGFQKMFVERLKMAARKAEKDFESEKELFLESSFTISQKEMPQFKKELRELLSRFVEEREVPEGEAVASLACAFFLPV
jgi:uncharacterized protein (TIGR02147 family)